MKLTFKQFFMIPVMIAVLAFILMLVDLGFGKALAEAKNYFVIWIAFQAWAMYFMAGCTYTGGAKVFLGYLGGAVASTIIMEAAGSMTFLGTLAAPVAVLIFVVPIICFERVPWFDFIPAWFVGAGAFFGLTGLQGAAKSGWGHLDVGIACLLSCTVGMIFGVLTVIGRGKYEAMLAAKAEAAGEAPAEAAAPADEAPAEGEE